MSGHFLGLYICINIVVDQALDTDVYVVRSRVYPGHFHDPILGLTVHNFQTRYGGLCTIMYVSACYRTN